MFEVIPGTGGIVSDFSRKATLQDGSGDYFLFFFILFIYFLNVCPVIGETNWVTTWPKSGGSSSACNKP